MPRGGPGIEPVTSPESGKIGWTYFGEDTSKQTGAVQSARPQRPLSKFSAVRFCSRGRCLGQIAPLRNGRFGSVTDWEG